MSRGKQLGLSFSYVKPEMIRMYFFVDVGRGTKHPKEATGTAGGVR